MHNQIIKDLYLKCRSQNKMKQTVNFLLNIES